MNPPPDIASVERRAPSRPGRLRSSPLSTRPAATSAPATSRPRDQAI